MTKRIFLLFLIFALTISPAYAKEDYIRWVDFQVGYEALKAAMDTDIRSHETERPVSWICLLALASARSGGGKLSAKDVQRAEKLLLGNQSLEKLLGKQYSTYEYYKEAYGAILDGLLGSYAIYIHGQWVPQYGLKAFSPIAAGYGYSHYEDFGSRRSYGFVRRHLGNDLMGTLGTPIVAVEGGTVEAMGWNRYGGWRIGIRSHDKKRYYYYAHLQKDHPFPPELKVGDTIQAGDVIGFMGRTGYSDKENVNNIDAIHLHFGIQLIFDESQKECDNEIWIDPYSIVRLLSSHRSSLQKSDGRWERMYPYKDLDRAA